MTNGGKDEAARERTFTRFTRNDDTPDLCEDDRYDILPPRHDVKRARAMLLQRSGCDALPFF